MNPGDLLLRPELLPILLAVPLAWFALRAADVARARRRAALLGPRGAALVPGFDPRRLAARGALLAAGLLCALAALLEPARGEGTGTGTPRGADVVLALDVSRSMLARDESPDRLARAKAEIRALVAAARGDRLALVAFAGEARLLVPLTRDLGTLSALAETADALSVRRGGTDLGAALEASLAALDAATSGPGVVILLTDGEDHGGRGLRAAARLRQRGVVVHALALGADRGARIPVAGARGEEFQRDAEGREVVSAPDRAALARLAAAGGGRLAGRGLADLYHDEILSGAARSAGPADRRSREPLFPWPLFAAFALWMVGTCLPERSRS